MGEKTEFVPNRKFWAPAGRERLPKIDRLVESVDSEIAEPIKRVLREFTEARISKEEAKPKIMRLVERKIDLFFSSLGASKEK